MPQLVPEGSRTTHRTIFSSRPRCPASHVTATRGTIDKPVTMYSRGTGKLLAAVVVAVAVLAGVTPCAAAGRVQRTRYVEGVSQMYFPRFHIRTDGRPGWLIESMKCTTHGGVPVQLAPCPNSASGTCYMVTNKVQYTLPSVWAGNALPPGDSGIVAGILIRVVHAVVAQTLVANTGPGLNSNRVNCSVTTNLKQGTTDFPLLAWELVDDGSYGPQSYGALCRSHGRGVGVNTLPPRAYWLCWPGYRCCFGMR